MISSNVPITDESLLMQRDEELQQQLIGGAKQASTTDMEATPRNRGSRVGMKNENGREFENVREIDKNDPVGPNQQNPGNKHCQVKKDEANHGLTQHRQKPNGRKWKLQARVTKSKTENLIGLLGSKKIGGDIGYKSLEKKKRNWLAQQNK